MDLAGQEAIDLWLEGKDEWNRWVSEHPEADISFRDEDFSKFRTEDDKANKCISFSGYHFPKGNVDFSHATFGDGDVSFDGATFGDGDVSFDGATFGDGIVSFSEVAFGDGDVSFDGATFGDGIVSYDGATFGDGEVSFRGAAFGDGDISFDGATFGDGIVSFSKATFGDGEVSFRGAAFGDGDVYFRGAAFGDGEVSFRGATFGDGEVSFTLVTFGTGPVNFENTFCKGHVNFFMLQNVQQIHVLSLRYSNFEKSLNLSENQFDFVIDLTSTKTTNQVSLEGLRCSFKRNWYGKASDCKDIARLRRLKEIADANKDHAQALHFHAEEMRAKRWHETKLFRGLELDYCFDWFSRYGQSIGRPMAMLVLITCLFGFFYQSKIPECAHEVTFVDVMVFSASQILPFIPSSSEARQQGISKLYGSADAIPYELHAWILLQGGISFIFLFLVGLGLRNRFRI